MHTRTDQKIGTCVFVCGYIYLYLYRSVASDSSAVSHKNNNSQL